MISWKPGDSPEQLRRLAGAYATLADRLGYVAGYEQARLLLAAGDRHEARELFLKLYREHIAKGQLPRIGQDFRRALGDQSEDAVHWRAFVLETTDQLRDNWDHALLRSRRRSTPVIRSCRSAVWPLHREMVSLPAWPLQ